MALDQPVESLPRTSSVTFRKFRNLGINTYRDLLNYFPSRYENYSLVSKIGRIQPGEVVTVKGTITKAKFGIAKTGTKIQTFEIEDDTGKLTLQWYNQPYLLRMLRPGVLVSVAGDVKPFLNRLTVEPREFEIINSFGQKTIHTGRIVPVYPEKKGLSSKTIRDKIFNLINHLLRRDEISELLPGEIISFNKLVGESEAYWNVHFPETISDKDAARRRLAFDELFAIQMSVHIIRKSWANEIVSEKFIIDSFRQTKLKSFLQDLPFKLTVSQETAVREILTDLSKPQPMNRFLQGDVGSGKTVVAAIACYLSYLNNCRSVIMAPTEILAQQHFQTISDMFKTTGVKIGLMTGTIKLKDSEKADILVGTHALLSKKLLFNKLGLVVIDEQHRFGVAQRAMMRSKGINPHILTMTATPIPRTIALTFYGELDLSTLDELPAGRLVIKTWYVPKIKRLPAYDWIKKQINENRSQVFVICPLIDESESETMQSVKAAKKEYDYLKNEIFTNLRVGLLHGKLKSTEKSSVMNDFKDKKIDVLISTSVVEVGIDVPNATIMMIEGAERFGLAQLHQLRGRVGRGHKQSYCLLFSDQETPASRDRLDFFSKTLSGIKLAEYDLKIRGPGNLFGLKQHGFLNLKIASLSDQELMNQTKAAVSYYYTRYSGPEKFPELNSRVIQYETREISPD